MNRTASRNRPRKSLRSLTALLAGACLLSTCGATFLVGDSAAFAQDKVPLDSVSDALAQDQSQGDGDPLTVSLAEAEAETASDAVEPLDEGTSARPIGVTSVVAVHPQADGSLLIPDTAPTFSADAATVQECLGEIDSSSAPTHECDSRDVTLTFSRPVANPTIVLGEAGLAHSRDDGAAYSYYDYSVLSVDGRTNAGRAHSETEASLTHWDGSRLTADPDALRSIAREALASPATSSEAEAETGTSESDVLDRSISVDGLVSSVSLRVHAMALQVSDASMDSWAPSEAVPVPMIGVGVTDADLAVSMAAPEELIAGDTVRWELAVENRSERDAHGLILQHPVPEGISDVRITAGSEQCAIAGGLLECAVSADGVVLVPSEGNASVAVASADSNDTSGPVGAALAAGATFGPIVLEGVVADDADGVAEFVAVVRGADVDPDTTNNLVEFSSAYVLPNPEDAAASDDSAAGTEGSEDSAPDGIARDSVAPTTRASGISMLEPGWELMQKYQFGMGKIVFPTAKPPADSKWGWITDLPNTKYNHALFVTARVVGRGQAEYVTVGDVVEFRGMAINGPDDPSSKQPYSYLISLMHNGRLVDSGLYPWDYVNATATFDWTGTTREGQAATWLPGPAHTDDQSVTPWINAGVVIAIDPRRNMGQGFYMKPNTVGAVTVFRVKIRTVPPAGYKFTAVIASRLNSTAGGGQDIGVPATIQNTSWNCPGMVQANQNCHTRPMGILTTLPDYVIPVKKVGEQGETLSGASFTVQPDLYGAPDPDTAYIKTVSGGSSITLKNGVYWITETKAPGSHVLLAKPVAFEVAGDGTITIQDADQHPQVTTDGTSITVSDSRALGLPAAGGEQNEVLPVVLGATSLLGALLIVLVRRRQRRQGLAGS